MYTQAIVLSTATCYTIDINKNLYFSFAKKFGHPDWEGYGSFIIDGPRDMA